MVKINKAGSVQFSCLVAPCSLWPHGLQHTRFPCPSTPRARSNSCPSSWCCHPTISSSVVPFSTYLQSFPAQGSFLMSQFFTSCGQTIRASASVSVLPVNVTMLVINSKEYFHYHVAMASMHLFYTRSYYSCNNRWQVLLLLLLFSYQW